MAPRDAAGGPQVVELLLSAIRTAAARLDRPVRLMEVCGTHTMAIRRAGLPSLLPENVRLLSGPGCPVCVTPTGYLDAAIRLARGRDLTIATFGDMMRVPGSASSLERERAAGADVRVVYSALDALRLAERETDRTVVFLAVGFETTAPGTAVALAEARRRLLTNFLVLCAHKLIPPALGALLADRDVAVDGFILPGHVSVILGRDPYEFVAREYGKAAVIAGFDTADVLQAVLLLLRQILSGQPAVEIQYRHVVRPEGNPEARRWMEACLEVCDTEWRGLGRLPRSGLRLRPEFAHQDAAETLGVEVEGGEEPAGCRCGDVLRGVVEPEGCALFGRRCTPRSPVGPCMVSSEGTCAAHFKYGRG